MACWSCGECPNHLRAHKMLFFNMMKCQHISTMRWQHFWISSWPLKGSPLSGLHTVQTWPPLDFFPWGFLKDEVYIPWMPLTLNLKDQIQTVTAKNEQPLLQDVWCDVESTYWICVEYEKNIICSLEWRVFNVCMPLTFLPINLCNHSHILCIHPYTKYCCIPKINLVQLDHANYTMWTIIILVSSILWIPADSLHKILTVYIWLELPIISYNKISFLPQYHNTE
jgi:hypothetical protein